jgi:hypothetical protein
MSISKTLAIEFRVVTEYALRIERDAPRRCEIRCNARTFRNTPVERV